MQLQKFVFSSLLFFFIILFRDLNQAFDFTLLGWGGQPWGYLSCSMCCCRSPVPPPSLGHLLWLDITRPPPHSPCLGSALQPHLFLGLTWPLGLAFWIFHTCFVLKSFWLCFFIVSILDLWRPWGFLKHSPRAPRVGQPATGLVQRCRDPAHSWSWIIDKVNRKLFY